MTYQYASSSSSLLEELLLLEEVESLLEELDQIETDTDDRQADLRGALYKIEDDLAPVDVMFLYRVIELTGEIADMAERVGRRLELLLSH